MAQRDNFKRKKEIHNKLAEYTVINRLINYENTNFGTFTISLKNTLNYC